MERRLILRLSLFVFFCLAVVFQNPPDISSTSEKVVLESLNDPDDVFWDPRFNALGLSGRVEAIVVDGADVYVGGQFQHAGGLTVNGIARWDGTQWYAMGSGVSGASAEVRAILVHEGNVYIGGSFVNAGGVPCQHVAMWDGLQWHAMGTGLSDYHTVPPVDDLEVFDGDVYVSGSFEKADGITVNGIARWDGAGWNSLNGGLTHPGFATGFGDAMAADASQLYVGGLFTAAGGVPALSLARWDGTNWSALDAFFNGELRSMALVGTDLYVGGLFNFTQDFVTVTNVAKWDGSSWDNLDGGANERVMSVVSLGTDVYIAGNFTSAGGISANRIAKWDGSQWSTFGSGLGFSSGSGWTFAASPSATGEVFAGGDFDLAGGKTSLKFARWFVSPPPNIEVAPDSLIDSLYTGQTSSQNLTITNIGGMTLSWGVNTTEPWVSANPDTGVFNPGYGAVVEIEFDAAGLGGNYEDTARVVTNHPSEPEILVPLRLFVTAVPLIAVSDTVMSFGLVAVGDSVDDTLTVSNVGADTLHVAVEVDQPDFTPSDTLFDVEPGGSWPLVVTFAPSVEGIITGTMTIISNDPDEDSVFVSLEGEGREPVNITVTPDSLSESLYTGEVSTQVLTIENLGQSAFDWTLKVRRRSDGGGSPASMFGTRRHAFPTGTEEDAFYSADPIRLGPGDFGPFSSSDLTGVRIIYDLSHGQHDSSNRSIFVAGLIDLGATFVESSSSITPTLLADYDIFWTVEMTSEFTAAERNTLADWVLGGGGLFLTGDQQPGIGSYNDLLGQLGAGIVYDTGGSTAGTTSNIYPHETTFGVNTIELPGPHAHLSAVMEPATLLIGDINNTPVVAASVAGDGKIIATAEELFGDDYLLLADNQRFGEQAMEWLTPGIGWVWALPDSGSIPVGQSEQIDVTFDATNLPEDEFDAEIAIRSTAWDSVVAIVPLHLEVMPAADILLSDTVLVYDSLFVGLSDDQTLTVSNEGNATLIVSSISIDNPSFSADSTELNIPPGWTRDVTVTFAPLVSGSISGTLTLESNDPDENIVTVDLEGVGVEPPIVAVLPDSIYETLLPGEASLRPLDLSNPGGSVLEYRIYVFGTAGSNPSPVGTVEMADRSQGRVGYRSDVFGGFLTSSGSVSQLEPYETAGHIRPLSGIRPILSSPFDSSLAFLENFEDGDYDGWFDGGGTGTKEVTDQTAADGSVMSYHEFNSGVGHFDGIYREFGAVQLRTISFWIRSGSTTTNDAYFVFRDSQGREVIWFFAKQDSTFYVNVDVGGSESFVYTADTWYHIEFNNIDFTAKTFDYYVGGNLIQSGIPFRNAALVEDVYRLDLYNFTAGSEAWWDEIWISTGIPIDWLTASPLVGTLDPGSTIELAVTIDASLLEPGTYEGYVGIQSNVPTQGFVTVPVTLDVDSALTRTVVLPLETGWNLLSWNADVGNDSVASILAPIIENVIVAHGFDTGGRAFAPSLAPEFQTLFDVDHADGVWVKMSQDDTLSLAGDAIASQSPVALSSGYNLIGYVPYQEDSVAHALETVLSTTDLVLGHDGNDYLTFDPSGPPGQNTLITMTPGHGYWLKVNTAGTLTYPGLPAYPSDPPFTTSDAQVPSGPVTVTPTTEWVNLWGDSVVIDGSLISVGTLVQAIDEDSVICGEFVVTEEGCFGIMPVYRDDPFTPEDEGPEPGEEVRFLFDRFMNSRVLTWSENGDIIDFKTIPTGMPAMFPKLPDRYVLYQNHPNPFNPVTTIRYELPERSHVRLAVYNVRGELVRVLVDRSRPAGRFEAHWNGSNSNGEPVASGVYFYKLTTKGFTQTKKMVLLK
ncbi:MAG: choice-of-anchor D domain-containing protein [Candidatus Latescibacterota bacterium]|nr:MAG: choice-of-anchor D domain-containing protein [Candidatus Latescibacterota bacterium]